MVHGRCPRPRLTILWGCVMHHVSTYVHTQSQRRFYIFLFLCRREVCIIISTWAKNWWESDPWTFCVTWDGNPSITTGVMIDFIYYSLNHGKTLIIKPTIRRRINSYIGHQSHISHTQPHSQNKDRTLWS